MDKPEIVERLTRVFRDVFDEPDLQLHEGMTAKDVSRWNSTTHIFLICAVEEAFKIRFSTRQVGNMQDVGDLIALVEQKTAGA
jgi:acyl carrier protein